VTTRVYSPSDLSVYTLSKGETLHQGQFFFEHVHKMARIIVALCLAHAAIVGDALGYGVPKKDPLEVPSEAYDVNADPSPSASPRRSPAYGDGDHVTLPEGQEAADVGLPPGFVYPVSMWDSPPGYFLPPFMGSLMSTCVLATNAVLYGVDAGLLPNRKASVMHVALKSTLDRQCE